MEKSKMKATALYNAGGSQSTGSTGSTGSMNPLDGLRVALKEAERSLAGLEQEQESISDYQRAAIMDADAARHR